MKIVHESVFISALRSFFVAFFGIIGAAIALFAIIFACVTLSKSGTTASLPTSVKILPDATGNRKQLAADTPVLLQISIDGKIGSDDLTASRIENILLKSREGELKGGRVKGILLHINTPGGSVNDSDLIFRHLKQYKERHNVPIFAYVDGMCASGGYYIACAADKILASDVSLIGSIGVLAWPPFLNLTTALEKLGVSALTVYAGKDKDQLNPLRPWREGEQESYQQLINFFYDRFLTLVVEARPEIDQQQLIDNYGAHVFPSPLAHEHGFIDGTSSHLSEALDSLANTAGIEKGESYQVIGFESDSWWKRTFKADALFKRPALFQYLY